MLSGSRFFRGDECDLVFPRRGERDQDQNAIASRQRAVIDIVRDVELAPA
jgi:hypothetical protein